MKKRLLALFMVLVLCMSMVMTGCKKSETKPDDSTTPKSEITLESSMEKTANALLGAENSSDSLLDRALNKGKITVGFGGVLENVLYLDSTEQAFADNLTLNAEGQTMSLGIYGKDNEIAIAAPELLGDTVYGINLDTLLTDLKDSEIWSLMGTDYDTFMSEFGEQFEQLAEMFKDIDPDTVTDMTGDFAKKIAEALKDVEVTTEEGKVEIDGKEVKAVIIKYHMDRDDVLKLMDVMLDWMEDAMSGLMEGIEEALGEGAVDYGEAGSLEGAFDQMREELETEFEGVEIACDYYAHINPKTEYVMQFGVDMTATYESETATIKAAFVLGEDPTTSNKYAFTMDVVGSDTEMNAEFAVSTKAEGDVETTTIELNMTTDGETQAVEFVFAWDKKANTYTLTGNADGSELVISGDLEVTENKLHFSIDEMDIDGDATELGLVITIETSVEGMPEMPAYSNILKLSADELTALITKLGAIVPSEPSYPSYPSYPDIEVNPIPGGNDEDVKDETVVPGSGAFANGPITVYDKNGCKLTFTNLEKDSHGNYRLSYEVTNNTSGEVSFSTDNCAINGITTNLFIYEEVAPGTTVTGAEIFYVEDLKLLGIDTIYNINCYDGQIMDTENFDFEYPVAFELDCGDKDYVENVDMSGEVIYEGNGIKLINKGVVEDGHGDVSVVFLLVNNRNDHIAIDIDDVYANGIETDKFGYGYAYAGTVGYYDSFWFESDLKDVGGKLNSMSFVMEIEDMLDYEEIAEEIKVSAKF